jgi:hypothetical protein
VFGAAVLSPGNGMLALSSGVTAAALLVCNFKLGISFIF